MGTPEQVAAYKSEQQSLRKKVANFEKHLRIAEATENPVERMSHLKKAQKLGERYGFPLRQKTV